MIRKVSSIIMWVGILFGFLAYKTNQHIISIFSLFVAAIGALYYFATWKDGE